MSESRIMGINENEINSLYSQMSRYAEAIKKDFNDISTAMEETKTIYKSETATALYNSYSEVETNFPFAIDNILSLAEEFIALRRKYEIHDEATSTELFKTSAELSSKYVKYEEVN